MKRLITLIMLLSAVLAMSCSKWRVNELLLKNKFLIPSGEDYNKISLKIKNNDTFNLTFNIVVSNGKVICADNIQNKIVVYDMDGKAQMVIGKTPYSLNIPSTQYLFGMIGKIVSDKEGNVYVQNSSVPNESTLKKATVTETDVVPSYISVFNNSGKLIYIIGLSEQGEIPFYYIDNIYTDDKSRLFVITRTSDSCSVYRFVEKKKDFLVNFDKDSFKEKADNEDVIGQIETVKIFKNGERFLLSVAYYSNTRFKYRKVIEYLVNENKLGKTILDLPDPKNELFSIMEDNYIVLWDIDQNDIKFSIWNLEENIINNLRLNMFEKGSYYEEVLVDEKGKLYSCAVRKEGLYIKEWE